MKIHHPCAAIVIFENKNKKKDLAINAQNTLSKWIGVEKKEGEKSWVRKITHQPISIRRLR